MIVEQLSLKNETWYNSITTIKVVPNLILLFVSPKFKDKANLVNQLLETYPNAQLLGCSTAGEISGNSVADESVSLTAITFEKAQHRLEKVDIDDSNKSFTTGVSLAQKLNTDNLKHILLFSDGLNVNGSELVSGIRSVLPEIGVTGCLAADGLDFNETFVIANRLISDKIVVGLGLYGNDLKVGYSSKSGWEGFGIERLVTKSDHNILYELDGLPALQVYKSFLGDIVSQESSATLRFPLSIRVDETDEPVIRTVVNIDEAQQSLTFTDRIPKDALVRLMNSNVDKLIEGAKCSATEASKEIQEKGELAILISCAGRRKMLKQLAEEEVDVVREIIGEKPKITGVYSYGEIGPFREFAPCKFHNQTITITLFSEC
ncbi:FIST signal transduction protein [Winogradskyella psychrotolerans]|uniref:FIST signal transduction protein n=1 Tax=Winogradskyella psychrotolerans TaxID=1344585 RepID=UPI001C0799B2|nr:FIST N-terminal domain-containing protein [Winogradskyella psychrotolerans]MBU2928476.1 FIST C-terminal domain-containing protein [Winogradskyella psychrotolerans]